MRALKIALLTVSLPAAFAAGALVHRPPATGDDPGRRVAYWHDPMHPDYKSDAPGTAPDCGMPLEPVYANDPAAQRAAEAAEGAAMQTIQLSADVQRMIGVKSEPARQSTGKETVRALGRVTADERRIYRVTSYTNGWIRQTFADATGSLVRRGDVLATFYAREFLAAQQSYFYALDALDRRAGTEEPQLVATRAQVQAAADSLEALGMSAAQVAELARTRRPTQEVEIRAPSGGLLLGRNVSPGQRVEGGEELFVVADLSHVVVIADLAQQDARYIRAGDSVAMTFSRDDRVFRGRISAVPPRFDAAAFTLKVRIEVENADVTLRPDMLLDVQFPLRVPEALTVPASAVLDTGSRATVFVDRGGGSYEPRVVETGWRYGDRVQIVRGLTPDERVVTAGTFLMDSESRLRNGEPPR
jgi:Cu(I)/Ag(I) efflux system membrane fusion protein